MTAVNTLKPVYFTTIAKICICSVWMQKCFNCIVSTSLFYRYKCICGSRFSVEAELELDFLRTFKSEMFIEIYFSFPIVNFKNSRSISSTVCMDGYRSLTSCLYLFLLSFLGGGGDINTSICRFPLVFAYIVAEIITKN